MTEKVKRKVKLWEQIVDQADPTRRTDKEPQYQFSNGRLFERRPRRVYAEPEQ